MMTSDRRPSLGSAAFFGAASLAVLGGFGLLRLASAYESYMLLFLSFGLMVWGILALFTETGRPSWA